MGCYGDPYEGERVGEGGEGGRTLRGSLLTDLMRPTVTSSELKHPESPYHPVPRGPRVACANRAEPQGA